MKNKTKLFAALIAVVMAFVALCPMMIASAATVKSISADTYVKVTSDKYYYKVVVAKEGYITLSAKLSEKKAYAYGYAYFDLLNSHKEEFVDTYPDYVHVSTSEKTSSLKIAVSKGTYYIHVKDYYNSDSSVAISVKYKFTAVTQPTNYCIGKAKTLSSGTTTNIYQTPSQTFDRWFKISLASSKKISITTKLNCYLYDNEGNQVDMDYSSSGYKSQMKLAKGTYYICAYAYRHPFTSGVYTLKWS